MPTLDWIGKSRVVNHHLDVPYHVLERVYSFDESGRYDGDNGSGNMIIHGDNLLALKSLLPQYEGRVKCIYIDPPYNTGNENWVYNDNVNDPRIKKWLGDVVGKEGEDLSRHDKWLCMMYPRLKLLQRLLAEDGAIFISIDDNELVNLSKICDEIWGTANFVDRITVIVKPEGRRYGFFAKTHESVLVYAKDITKVTLGEIEIEGKEYDYFDSEGGFCLKGLRNRNVRAFNSANRPNLRYPFYVNTNKADDNGLFEVSTIPVDGYKEVWAQTINGLESVWRWGKEKSTNNINQLCAIKGRDDTIRIFQKERKLTETAKTVWFDKRFNSIVGTRELKNIFSNAPFDFPKPVALIRQILEIATDKDSIVLDSFAGSGTTAHAVLDLNKEDGGNRKFLLVEMGDYAESITAERVKRVIAGYGEGKNAKAGTGGSFQYYELGAPLFHGEMLNEDVGEEELRRYVYFTETREAAVPLSDAEPGYLGTHLDVSYYFHYCRDAVTTLNRDFLRMVKRRSERYVVYADLCTISRDELSRRHIVFKKIPRDISRL